MDLTIGTTTTCSALVMFEDHVAISLFMQNF